MNNLELIKKAKQIALSGKLLDRESIISLLKIDPASEDCEFLGRTAREAASIICKDRAYIWATIGLDHKSCSMNCDFCSFGEKWGIVKDESEISGNEIIKLAHKYVNEGARWIFLRTTQFYSLEKLSKSAEKIRNTVPGEYELGVNIGEFDEEMAKKLAKAGVTYVYHSLRLREGENTRFSAKDRLSTLESVKNSPLKLAFFVEPIGCEHSNEEIADIFLTAMKYDSVATGAMARVPVPGTPLGNLPALSSKRLAQITAVTRLAAGYNAPDICLHPASEIALKWGANVVAVETGALPRDTYSNSEGEWRGFDTNTAKIWFNSSGYKVFSKVG